MEDALLVPLEAQLEERRRRDDLVGNMREVRSFYSTVLRVRNIRFGDAGAISRSQPRYGRATESINGLANAQPPVEQIF